MRRRSVCTPVPRPSQRSNLPTDGRTDGWGAAGEDRQPRPTHKDHRPAVRPSDRDRSATMPPCLAVDDTIAPGRQAGGRRGWSMPSRHRAAACMQATAAACPLTAAARSALPMTYRPPAAAATAALNATASQLCPPSCSNGKIYIKNQPEPKLTNAKSNPIRPVSLVRIGGDRATPSSSSFPWWRPRLRWDACLPAAIGWKAEVAADIFPTSCQAKTEPEMFSATSYIDQLITGRQLRSKAPRFHVSIDVNITAQLSLSKRCTAGLRMTPPTSATPALRHRAA